MATRSVALGDVRVWDMVRSVHPELRVSTTIDPSRFELILAQPHIERVSQRIAEEVESDDHNKDRDAGNDNRVRRDRQIVSVFGEHRSPLRARRLRSESEEAKTGRFQ